MTMSAPAARHMLRPWLPLAALGLATAVAGGALIQGFRLEFTYVVFVSLAGFAMGSPGLLMIGHLMNEHWLAPVRSEAEAAALTAPLLLLLGIPLAFNLEQLFPWAGDPAGLSALEAAFLSPGFFILRAVCYLLLCSGMAIALVRAERRRRASAIGLAILAPVMTLAAYDWVLARDPRWWPSLFGLAFGVTQVLAALAGAILITLLRPERPSTKRMVSLERALLTLSLLAVWTWFSQFLIVWLGNLPVEADWYLKRSDSLGLVLIGGASAVMLLAIVILVPSGVSRAGMIAGSVLVLLQYGLHTLWLLRPGWPPSWLDPAMALAFTALWSAALALLVRFRPAFEEEPHES